MCVRGVLCVCEGFCMCVCVCERGILPACEGICVCVRGVFVCEGICVCVRGYLYLVRGICWGV